MSLRIFKEVRGIEMIIDYTPEVDGIEINIDRVQSSEDLYTLLEEGEISDITTECHKDYLQKIEK